MEAELVEGNEVLPTDEFVRRLLAIFAEGRFSELRALQGHARPSDGEVLRWVREAHRRVDRDESYPKLFHEEVGLLLDLTRGGRSRKALWGIGESWHQIGSEDTSAT